MNNPNKKADAAEQPVMMADLISIQEDWGSALMSRPAYIESAFRGTKNSGTSYTEFAPGK